MKVALLGTGLLGYPMAERLLKEGHQLTVYNRTIEKAQPLSQKGARIASNAQLAIIDAECVLLLLADAKSIEEVLFQGEKSFLKNKTIIQMGTISSQESIEIQKKVYEYEGEYFECPVLGSRNEALNGTLLLMVGATEEKFEKWKSFLGAFGPNPRRIGKVGKAAALKLALNHLIAAHAACFSLSLGLIEKNEIDVELFMEILRESALYAPMYDKKLPNWLKHQYVNANFPVKHLLKDVDLIMNDANNKALKTDVLLGIQNILKGAVQKGLGEQDYSAIFEEIRK